MIQLHVWGKDNDVSVISPASIAATWLLNLTLTSQGVPFEVVTSNNTNLSSINELPVLIVSETEKYSGYNEIVSYVEENFKSEEYLGSKSMDSRQKLLNRTLQNMLTSKIQYINQYNLYSNTKNYVKFTRKLFASYFPFPMMYNQPSKYHNQAQEQIKLLGLSKNQVSFFNFISGSNEDLEVAQTEIFNDEISDDDEEDDEVAISSLHEKQLLKKSKTKQVLKESKNSMRCLILINHYINEVVKVYEKNGGDKDDNKLGFIFGNSPSSSELLFYAYIQCLTSDKLPDRFIYNYLLLKQPEVLKFINETTENYSSDVKFRDPTGIEVPSLFNEIGYLIGSIKY